MSTLWFPRPRAPKEISSFVYFEDRKGSILIPGIVNSPCPIGYEKKEIPTRNTREVERISARFNRQKQIAFEQADEKLQARIEAKEAEVRSNLRRIMASSSCTPWERDAIKRVLERMPELRRKKSKIIEGHLHMEAFEAGK